MRVQLLSTVGRARSGSAIITLPRHQHGLQGLSSGYVIGCLELVLVSEMDRPLFLNSIVEFSPVWVHKHWIAMSILRGKNMKYKTMVTALLSQCIVLAVQSLNLGLINGLRKLNPCFVAQNGNSVSKSILNGIWIMEFYNTFILNSDHW